MNNFQTFRYKHQPRKSEFRKILIGIVRCYQIMLQDRVLVPNHEREIRDSILKNYLNNNSTRKKVNLVDFLFDGEPIEYPDRGLVDIKISTKNTFIDTSAYYIIECKRLDDKNLLGNNGLNAKYISEGIIRFVSGHYSSYDNMCGMIGFIVKSINIANNISNINTLLKKPKFSNANKIDELKSDNFIENFNQSYLSTHKSNNRSNINIYHLMFDFSKNLYQPSPPNKPIKTPAI